ncbi:50S ribosomal protein L28 isoform X2 [Cajanus cajan]|uniref:50S ribosomal protein L28 isoform X2 n=1 Tax=Cajanus cajan TaxID=3821 RepID=UPI0010FADAFA|nr:50S ribosomal protein L28 isoform X2 [Cajanus cajan]
MAAATCAVSFRNSFGVSKPWRVCPFTGKKSNRANKVSFSNHKTKKLQFVNLQYKRIWWEAGKRYVKLRLSTKAYPLYLTCVAHESSSVAWKIFSFFWSCFKWFFSGIGDSCGFDNFPRFGLTLFKNTIRRSWNCLS